ncbi:hypothetical protein E1161_01160 [Saccharopolyspora aridisoli]|uniref:PucR C-terminal helix-turn-helix domain-containing protein n=1 Tax=Saccharopolyspora aridisoli TaxID=2530385 RepID=A0A4R4V1E8_9PSEU|nr:hypothetical protein E1161_01160 [Saccharopolyspora aridisoli]
MTNLAQTCQPLAERTRSQRGARLCAEPDDLATLDACCATGSRDRPTEMLHVHHSSVARRLERLGDSGEPNSPNLPVRLRRGRVQEGARDVSTWARDRCCGRRGLAPRRSSRRWHGHGSGKARRTRR